jgi:hypothetical protein
MFSPEQKRREAVLHLSALRKRLANRQLTQRSYPRMLKRIAIVEEMVADYEREIVEADELVAQMDLQWE